MRRHTKFGLKNFEIDFIIEINDIRPFGPSPGPQGAGQKCALARPIHVSKSYTEFGWISSNGLGGGRETIAISPSFFFFLNMYNLGNKTVLYFIRTAINCFVGM